MNKDEIYLENMFYMEKIVYNLDLKERIDSYLAWNFSYSRNFFYHIIEREWVLVNWKKIKKSYKLKKWDIIEIDNLERYLDSSFLEELPFVDIPILLEKQDYIIINKPKWVLSHPNSIWDLSAPSVVAFLYQKYKELPSIGNFIRAGLVHRLDKETDGLMIVAKTEKWLEYFKNLFNKKSQLIDSILNELWKENIDYDKLEKVENEVGLKKFYRAKVEITKKWELFLNSIDKFPYYITEIVKAKVPHSIEKMWITKIIWLNENNIKLQIITWRTHQIRYHLSSSWLSIVGDYLYWKEDKNKMQLTAYKLEFIDINWDFIIIEI